MGIRCRVVLPMMVLVSSGTVLAESVREVSPTGPEISALEPELEALYRDLQQHPELAFHEEHTEQALAKRVDAVGVSVPVAHACGHDLHMTGWYGAAKVMAGRRKAWHGTLMLVGQPEEETNKGAPAMLADGLFSRFPQPDLAISMHDEPSLPSAAPLRVLEHESVWGRLLAVVCWFEKNPRSGLYRRQLEIPGVDTKFIERYRPLLSELLERFVPPAGDRLSESFDARFGLRLKPLLIRFRLLDETQKIHGLSDISVPVTELAQLLLPVDDVIVTENEVNGLALLPRARSLVMFGQGYAVERLADLPWLAHKRIFYWGDIDTHGFAMLDRFRAHFPHAASLLMDRETFLAHRPMWVEEHAPSTESLVRLTDPERALHRELLRGVHGERLRLEQERISFRWVRDALDRAATGAPA